MQLSKLHLKCRAVKNISIGIAIELGTRKRGNNLKHRTAINAQNEIKKKKNRIPTCTDSSVGE